MSRVERRSGEKQICDISRMKRSSGSGPRPERGEERGREGDTRRSFKRR
jgi:hypothetical protein